MLPSECKFGLLGVAIEMNAPRIVGLALSAAGLSLALLSRIQLGRSFSMTPKASRFVTHGLYSRIRHPMYVFVDVTISGMALALERWWILVVLLILLPLQIRNTRRENKLLAESFGAEYRAWRHRTWL